MPLKFRSYNDRNKTLVAVVKVVSWHRQAKSEFVAKKKSLNRYTIVPKYSGLSVSKQGPLVFMR